jgi:uncharacterized protein
MASPIPRTRAEGVPSPCVDVCRIDEARGLCLGCARTLDEIAAWSTLDDEGKRAVWRLLPARREGAAGPAVKRSDPTR